MGFCGRLDGWMDGWMSLFHDDDDPGFMEVDG